MDRRGFLGVILAAAAAPAVVRAASLMPWKATASGLQVPQWGIAIPGIPEVRAAQAALNAEMVRLVEYWGRREGGELIRALVDGRGHVIDCTVAPGTQAPYVEMEMRSLRATLAPPFYESLRKARG